MKTVSIIIHITADLEFIFPLSQTFKDLIIIFKITQKPFIFRFHFEKS